MPLIDRLAASVARVVYRSALAAADPPGGFWGAAEQVGQIGEALGRRLRFVELSPKAARAQVAAAIGDEAFADHALDAWAGFVEHPEPVTDAVEEIAGTRARTFRQWARDHADAFR